MSEDITFAEAAERYDITLRQLRRIIDRGFLSVPAHGPGHQRHLTPEDQRVLAIIVRLVGIGFRFDAAAAIAREAADLPGVTLGLPGGVAITIEDQEIAA